MCFAFRIYLNKHKTNVTNYQVRKEYIILDLVMKKLQITKLDLDATTYIHLKF
jgi:hypothetical protein